MHRPWSEIVTQYRDAATVLAGGNGMLAICERIASTGLASGLYAWTSMHDLCIAQVPPYVSIRRTVLADFATAQRGDFVPLHRHESRRRPMASHGARGRRSPKTLVILLAASVV